MSELSQEQKDTVKTWIEAGESLSSVQSRIQEELGVSMTYMDVRFLVDDLGVELKDKESADPEAAEATSPEDAVLEPEPVDTHGDPLAADGQPQGGGSVQISVDKVQRPGAVVGGSVTFSDGVTAQWQIDQMGRLGIVPPQEGYQPPEADIEQFQTELQQVLQKQGF